MKTRLAVLSAGLEELGCEALLVLAPSAQDSDLASLLPVPAHLGECLLVLPRLPQGTEPRLGFMTPMEREEAAATGLALLTPEDLDVSRWSSELPDPAYFLAQVAGRALALCGVAPGRVALAGHGQAGVIQAACASLSGQGWTWVPGNALVYTAGAGEANNLTISVAGGTYTYQDTGVMILLSPNALSQGWSGNGTSTVTGPVASVGDGRGNHDLVSDDFRRRRGLVSD